MKTIHVEEKFMRVAIAEANKNKKVGDYPIGAVIVKDGKIIAKSPNRAKTDNDPTQHAEVAAIRKAAKKLGTRHLYGCILYTTHEPCPMCASACVWARLEGVVIGAKIADMAAFRQAHGNENYTWLTIDIPAREIFAKGRKPQVQAVEGVLREECKKLFISGKE